MDRLPTLLIVVPSSPGSTFSPFNTSTGSDEDQALNMLGRLNSTLSMALHSGLPIAIVAPAEEARYARKILSADSVIEIPSRNIGAPKSLDHQDSRGMISAIISGVMATANSEGWIISPPTDQPIELGSILEIAHSLKSSVIAFSQKMERPCFPIGFSSEMFSELIRMRSISDLNKIIYRYPATSLEKIPRGASLQH